MQQNSTATPLVSVLICTHNAQAFIAETLNSVLAQSYRHTEVLLLDNASTDGTPKLLQAYAQKDKRVRVYCESRNLGAYGGLNYLLDRATGAYIAINDHDDIWAADKLSKQVSFMEQNPDIQGCGCANINWYEKYNRYFLRTMPVRHTVAWHTSLLFRPSSKRYDETVQVGTDFDFMKRILCGGKPLIHNSREPLVLRRIWKKHNLSSSWIARSSWRALIGADIPLFDRLALVLRKLLGNELLDYVYTHYVWRRSIVRFEEVDKLFPGVRR